MMETVVSFLKSMGKIGAVGLIILGIGHMAAVFMGKIQSSYDTGGAMVLAGLSLLGIRKNQDVVKESVSVDASKLGDITKKEAP